MNCAACLQRAKDLLEGKLNSCLFKYNSCQKVFEDYNVTFSICINILTKKYEYIELIGDDINCLNEHPELTADEEVALEELFCIFVDLWLLKRNKQVPQEYRRYIYFRALGGVILTPGIYTVTYCIDMYGGLSTTLCNNKSETQTIRSGPVTFFSTDNIAALVAVAKQVKTIWPTLITEINPQDCIDSVVEAAEHAIGPNINIELVRQYFLTMPEGLEAQRAIVKNYRRVGKRVRSKSL